MNNQLFNSSFDRLFSDGLRQMPSVRVNGQASPVNPAESPAGSAKPALSGGDMTAALEKGYAALSEGRRPGAFAAELIVRRVDRAMGGATVAEPSLPRMGASVSPGGYGKAGESDNIPSPDKVAGTILGFVEKRIALAKADGASPERLDAMLQQARAGVEQGYGEAREELKARGFLPSDDGQLEKAIDAGYAAVQKGFAQVADNIAGRLPQTRDIAETASLAAPRSVGGAVTERSDFLRAESSVIQLKTRDGDTVKLSLSQVAAASAEIKANGGSLQEVLQGVSGKQFMLDVEGQLDEGELEAIGGFLKQIDSVANDFFAGDMQAAFDKALSLDVDMGEIASFAVNLSSVSYSSISQAYESGASAQPVKGQSAAEPALPANDFSPLARFIENLRSALESAEALNDGAGLLDFVEASAKALYEQGAISVPVAAPAGEDGAAPLSGQAPEPDAFADFLSFMRSTGEKLTAG
ncbi:DUF5610 domain-containing protein [Allohahella marinimesophila]|uniref:DUF5610 domain-containing protein n=1 Tax=Allohahella marinimesophila TaxID=1054972 RepID=A0ABP7PPN4_9GAMM